MVGTSSGLEPAPGSLPGKAVVLEAQKSLSKTMPELRLAGPFLKALLDTPRRGGIEGCSIDEWAGLWSADPVPCHTVWGSRAVSLTFW